MNSKDIVLITILFLVAFSLWTLPFQENPLPFGEGDSAWHFANGDPQFINDESSVRMPYFIGVWYYSLSKLGPFAPEYPPPNHLNYALMQIVGGERFVAPFIYIAITCFLGIFATFFLIRKLYGSVPAFIAGFGLIYSVREIMLYLWGQRPTMVSFVMIPMILYALYSYVHGYYTNKHKPIYLYLFFLLVAGQFLLHIQGSVITFLCSFMFMIFMIAKYRKLPISKSNAKHYVIGIVVLLVLIVPFVPIYYGLELGEASGERVSVTRLLKWSVEPGTYQGSYPDSYVQIDSHYHPLLLLLVGVGVILLLVRRKDTDLLILGWLAGVYLALHFDVFLGSSSPRIIRMMVAEPPLFFSLIGIALTSLVGFIPAKKQLKNILRIGVVVLFVVFLLQVKAPTVKSTLSGAYQGLSRINPHQFEVSEWMMENLPEDALLYDHGALTYPKSRWMLVVSNRHINKWWGTLRNDTYLTGPQYFIMDYSDLAYLQGNQQYAQQTKELQAFEEHNFGNQTAIYDKNNIRIYEIIGEVRDIA